LSGDTSPAPSHEEITGRAMGVLIRLADRLTLQTQEIVHELVDHYEPGIAGGTRQKDLRRRVAHRMAGCEAIPGSPRDDAGAVSERHRLVAGATRRRRSTGEDVVFSSSPLHPEFFSTRFETLVDWAQLRRIRLHDTRHTAASLMLASGAQVKVVADLLGHSSRTITLRSTRTCCPARRRRRERSSARWCSAEPTVPK
jgi:hypothetical protein